MFNNIIEIVQANLLEVVIWVNVCISSGTLAFVIVYTANPIRHDPIERYKTIRQAIISGVLTFLIVALIVIWAFMNMK